jgi:hypothetical protein
MQSNVALAPSWFGYPEVIQVAARKPALSEIIDPKNHALGVISGNAALRVLG